MRQLEAARQGAPVTGMDGDIAAIEAVLAVAKLHDDEASRTMLTTVQKIMNNVIEHAEGHARSAKSST